MAETKESGIAKKGTKAKLLSVTGAPKGDITLPLVFETEYRPDVIQRAFVAEASLDIQPYGTDKRAGFRTSADYFGRRREYYRMTVNKGISRLPRIKLAKGGLGQVRIVPHSKGGHRAHPPKAEKDWVKKINKKEWIFALNSAVAATTDFELAISEGRNHAIDSVSLPLIVEKSFEDIEKTSKIRDVLVSLGLEKDLERCSEKKNLAGRGKSRGRAQKYRTGVLIVVSGECKALKTAENLAGVSTVIVDNLAVSDLAPGGVAGRLTIWTEQAIKKMEEELQ